MIDALLQIGVSNAIAAAVLAVAACALARVIRRPPVVHALWLIVLVKFVTPPLYHLEFALPWWTSHDSPGVPADAIDTLTAAMPHDAGRRAIAMPIERAQPTNSPRAARRLAVLQEYTVEVGGPTTGIVEESHVDQARRRGDQVNLSVADRSFSERPALVEQHRQPSIAPMPNDADLQASSIMPSFAPVLSMLVFVAWLVGTASWLVLAAWRLRRFARLVRRAKPADNGLAVESARLARLLGLSQAPRVRIANVCISPLVWSIGGRPIVLLPATLLARLDRRQVSALLTHELAHVRRGDHHVRWLEMAVLALYWWCPVVWWARRQLRQAEEDCCDAWVAWALPDDRHAYATAVLESVELISAKPAPLPVAASGLASIDLLQRRLEMILHGFHGQSLRRLSGRTRLALLISAVFVLPLSAQVTSDTGVAPADGIAGVSGDDPFVSDAAVDSGDAFAEIAASEAVSDTAASSEDSAISDVFESSAAADTSGSAVESAGGVAFNTDSGAESTATATDRLGVNATSAADVANAAPISPIENAFFRNGQTFVAQARLVDNGKQVELRYPVRRPVVEHAVRDGRPTAEQRWVVEHLARRIALNQVRATVIGKGELSNSALQDSLRTARNVVVATAKSGVLELLRDGTLVIFVNGTNDEAAGTQAVATVPADAAGATQFPPTSATIDASAFSGDAIGWETALHADAFSGRRSNVPRSGFQAWPVPHRAATQDASGNLATYVAADEPASGPQPIVLQMDRDGNVLVLGQKTPLDRLAAVMQAMSFLIEEPEELLDGSTDEDRQLVDVVLALPENVSASHAVKLIEICKEAGFERLRLRVSRN